MSALIVIHGQGVYYMAMLDDLVKEVEETEGAAASTKVLVARMWEEIKALKSSDPAEQAKIDELATRLNAVQDSLAAAVAAAAEPEVVPAPVEPAPVEPAPFPEFPATGGESAGGVKE